MGIDTLDLAFRLEKRLGIVKHDSFLGSLFAPFMSEARAESIGRKELMKAWKALTAGDVVDNVWRYVRSHETLPEQSRNLNRSDIRQIVLEELGDVVNKDLLSYENVDDARLIDDLGFE